MKKLFNKKAFALLLCLVLALTALFTVTAFADTEPASDAPAQTEQTTDSSVDSAKAMASAIAIGVAAAGGDSGVSAKAIASGVAIGVAAAGGAIGMGMAIAKSAEGIARQPEAEGKIRTTMMLGLVFLETAIIYALLVVILIIFVL